ncbi:MAG: hypothetical protein WB949_04425 [Candidatus Acidiferrales bacterium]
MKNRAPSSTHKKVVVLLLSRAAVRGYLNPATLGTADEIELLTMDGEQKSIRLNDVKSVYFVREFKEPFEPERKTFLSRPKLDGLWVRLRFRDEDAMEGIVSNNLLDLLDTGVRLTPPDLHGNVLHMFIPRTALAEMKVLGVVGVARRSPRATRDIRAIVDAQSKLFSE